MNGHKYRALQLLNVFSIAALSLVAAQDPLHFTSGVTDPAPQPGQPFTFTWAGGDADTTVFIVLDYLFQNTPNQVIPGIKTDILSNAPNNGSWTYNVPSDIFPGRYTFDIGLNPLLLSDSTGVFTIINSIPSITLAPSPASTVSSNYNGCGLPPLPDYTYTGYQPPCTITTNGHIETIYPVVPASLSSSFYGPNGIFATDTRLGSVATPPNFYSTTSETDSVVTSSDTTFAAGSYAQALQCPTAVTPTMSTITVSGTATVLSAVGCADSTDSSHSVGGGVCHTSGYVTFSVSGTRSVCCPNEWSTTPLNSELYCYSSIGLNSKRDVPMQARDATTTTEVTGANTVITIEGIAFTPAGTVIADAMPASATSGGPSQTSPPAKSIGGQTFLISSLGYFALVGLLALSFLQI